MGLRECPCKFRLGFEGNEAPATVTVTAPNGTETVLTGTMNFNAVECFTGAAMCNPAVDNFEVNFGTDGTTINFTQGRRDTINCNDNNFAELHGTANGTGNGIVNQQYVVDFTYSISGTTATFHFFAQGTDGTTFETTPDVIASVATNPKTFIGNCDETVGP